MKSRIQKWGNSLAVRIPRAFAEEANLHEDTLVDLSVREGKMIVEPQLTLESLVDEITDANRHRETDTGAAVGEEVW
ncbi:MAG: AbrB/MazE/SpoVT family DNA-binding domain-containing protein [Acidobacteriota bacterium]